jgi:DNA-binding helix-hairpin-helix protein with protein kinase domain
VPEIERLNVIPHLTTKQRERLIELLIEEGCQCEEDTHQDTEDATSLNCLAGATLHDLNLSEKKLKAAINYGLARDKELTTLRKEFVEGFNLAAQDAYKVRCYEYWLETLANHEDLDTIPTDYYAHRLRTAIIGSKMVLEDPSVFDPEEIEESRRRAMEALESGDVVILEPRQDNE